MLSYFQLWGIRFVLRAVAPLLVGAFAATKGYDWFSEVRQRNEHSIEAEAKILTAEPQAGGVLVTYEYYDGIGKPYPGKDLLTGKWAELLATTSRLTITYREDEPREHHIGARQETDSSASLAILQILAGAICMGWSFLGFAELMKRLRNLSRLFREGKVVQTNVRSWVRENDASKVWRINYAFHGPDGRWYEGWSDDLPASLKPRWPEGSPLLVVYDPANPRKSTPDLFGVRAKDVPVPSSQEG
jgi:hypothetical protein